MGDFNSVVEQDDLPDILYQVVGKCTECLATAPVSPFTDDITKAIDLATKEDGTMIVDDDGEMHHYRLAVVSNNIRLEFVPPITDLDVE